MEDSYDYIDEVEDIVDGWNRMYRRIEKMRVNTGILKSLIRAKAGLSDEEISEQVVKMGGFKEEL